MIYTKGGTGINNNTYFSLLKQVGKPGRYAGGEFGSVYKKNKLLNVLLSYPDLYEIGMSNLALRILYNLINSLEDIYCERVFAPAPDFEKLIRGKNIPLFSIETKKPVNEFDLICFTIGYELTITNLLNILELSNINLNKNKRIETDPVVIAGGPSVSNPLPFSDFIDCFFIGESEEWVVKVFPEILKLKKEKAKRKDIILYLNSLPDIFTVNKKEKVQKRIWNNFSNRKINTLFPVPNIKIVQDHGVVEIMRGCPNGCRFCFAGYLYRPYRIKDINIILEETDDLIMKSGYREITLSSLSSGDYKNLPELIGYLNNRYKDLHVSFALPSLKVNTFTLSLLKEISEVRKSGLTFAVETPDAEWQKIINKTVTIEKTTDILKEAKRLGWKKAKFYFMLGLPVSENNKKEEELIVNFLTIIKELTGMQISVNIACFIPKPHTPFEYCRQLTEDEALHKIMFVKNNLKKIGIKVSYHSPFTSVLEGIISRGDKRTGKIILNAYKKGARLDAWQEYINREIWRDAISNTDWDVLNDTLSLHERNTVLPWDVIDIGVSKDFFNKEFEKSKLKKLSPNCTPDCNYKCGICNNNNKVIDKTSILPNKNSIIKLDKSNPVKLLIRYSKKDSAIFCSHLDTITIFERTLVRAGFYACFSHGFNPKPLIKFAHPLSLGLYSDCEIVSVEIYNFTDDFSEKMNSCFPSGFNIVKFKNLSENNKENNKNHSLMSLYWGSDYMVSGENIDKLKFKINNCNSGNELFSLKNVKILSSGNKELLLRIMNTGRKDSNILKIIEYCTEDPDIIYELNIHRKVTWAKSIDGNPVSYFEL